MGVRQGLWLGYGVGVWVGIKVQVKVKVWTSQGSRIAALILEELRQEAGDAP